MAQSEKGKTGPIWVRESCYNKPINNSLSLNKLVATLRLKGGRIDKYYLQEWNKNKHAIVFLNGWFGGKNIREAIIKALA
jgi:hypothetical protein